MVLLFNNFIRIYFSTKILDLKLNEDAIYLNLEEIRVNYNPVFRFNLSFKKFCDCVCESVEITTCMSIEKHLAQ